MKAHLFNLCDESASFLPKHGKSAFVRSCILEIGRRELKSKGSTPGPDHITSPAATVEPVTVKPYNPADWKRDGVRVSTAFPPGFNYSTLRYRRNERGISVCTNPPPWPAVPSLDMNHSLEWTKYVDKWRWVEPFPGPLEWVAMGQPEEPLPEHRRLTVEPVTVKAVEPVTVKAVEPVTVKAVEPVAVEPVTVKAVEPVAVEPVTVKAVEPDAVPPQPASEDSPLQGGRVSGSVLDDI
jgi:hypothetical protein